MKNSQETALCVRLKFAWLLSVGRGVRNPTESTRCSKDRDCFVVLVVKSRIEPAVCSVVRKKDCCLWLVVDTKETKEAVRGSEESGELEE